MQLPLQITFRNLAPSEAVAQRIRAKAAELDQFHRRIMSCRVIVEALHRHHRKGRLFHVRIDIGVPGREIVVSRDPHLAHEHEDVFVAIRDAFDAAARRLEDFSRRRRADTKIHEVPQHGQVTGLFPREGYGFLRTPEGLDVYFHRNAVLRDEFDELRIGSEVRFVMQYGEKGPQASSVSAIGKHHLPDVEAVPT
jgi:cold shock CspA family protein/ribosome-associated translation inhibitor RaiA